MNRRLLVSLMLGSIAALGAALSLAAAEIKLPAESARLSESKLPGYSLAMTYCFTCHSTDYVIYQPSSTRATWKASVTKMQKVLGAPIPDTAVEPIAEYLAQTYGAERSKPGEARPTSGEPAGKTR